jgi:hypothetical protein
MRIPSFIFKTCILNESEESCRIRHCYRLWIDQTYKVLKIELQPYLPTKFTILTFDRSPKCHERFIWKIIFNSSYNSSLLIIILIYLCPTFAYGKTHKIFNQRVRTNLSAIFICFENDNTFSLNSTLTTKIENDSLF